MLLIQMSPDLSFTVFVGVGMVKSLVATNVQLASRCRGNAGDVVVEYRRGVGTAVVVVCEVLHIFPYSIP